jgi:hypothetical protein
MLMELINSLVEINHNIAIQDFLDKNIVEEFINDLELIKLDIDDVILIGSLTQNDLKKFRSTFNVKLNNIDTVLNNINAEIKNNGGKYNG